MVALAWIVLAQSDFHGSATLLTSREAVRPGETFNVAVRIGLDPGWHTYWQNPGDAGIPPAIKWSLPKGWTAGPIRWPAPKKLIAPEVVSYGYESQALLFVRLTAPKSAPVGSVAKLKAHVEWLVCREGCIPASGEVQADVRVSKIEKLDAAWRKQAQAQICMLPAPAPSGSLTATGSGRAVLLHVADHQEPTQLTFFSSDGFIEPSAPQPFTAQGKVSLLNLTVSSYATGTPARLRGILMSTHGSSVQSEAVDIPLTWRKS